MQKVTSRTKTSLKNSSESYKDFSSDDKTLVYDLTCDYTDSSFVSSPTGHILVMASAPADSDKLADTEQIVYNVTLADNGLLSDMKLEIRDEFSDDIIVNFVNVPSSGYNFKCIRFYPQKALLKH